MVVQLAINLLGDRDEALDLSQEVFLRVFRTIHRFRGQSSLRTWIYRIAVNQARNRHRFWRRRHRADQVSLDEHVAAHGEFLSGGESTPDRVLAQKELAARLRRALDQPAVRSADGDRAARGRRPELRRDRVFARRGDRHGQIAPDARPPGAAPRAARGEDRMKTLDLRGGAPPPAGVPRRRAAGRRPDRGRRALDWCDALRARAGRAARSSAPRCSARCPGARRLSQRGGAGLHRHGRQPRRRRSTTRRCSRASARCSTTCIWCTPGSAPPPRRWSASSSCSA